MLAALGWIGAVLLALCGVPLLVATRWGDRAFLWLWWAGEVITFTYTLSAVPTAAGAPLLGNYAANLVLVSLVLWRRRAR